MTCLSLTLKLPGWPVSLGSPSLPLQYWAYRHMLLGLVDWYGHWRSELGLHVYMVKYFNQPRRLPGLSFSLLNFNFLYWLSVHLQNGDKWAGQQDSSLVTGLTVQGWQAELNARAQDGRTTERCPDHLHTPTHSHTSHTTNHLKF